MGESGLIYLLIPLVYFWVLISALLLAVIFAIFKRTRFLSSPLTLGALISIAGLILSICQLAVISKWADSIQQRLMSGTTVANWLDFLCRISPLAPAPLCLLTSYGG